MTRSLLRLWRHVLTRPSSHPRGCRSTARRGLALTLECLERRLVLSSPTITLDPQNDEFGAEILTVTQLGDPNRVALGILDTGASPITVAPDDQASFADPYDNPDPIPIKVPGGANANG